MNNGEEKRLLPHIPGPILSAAKLVLPDPNTCLDAFREVQIITTVRYERKRATHGKSSHCYWLADSAEIKYSE